MISKMANKFITFLERKKALSNASKEVYIYGADIVLYTILSTLGLVLTGFVFGKTSESIIIILLFYFNQSTGGGFHAKTHFKCFFLMFTGLSFALFLIELPRVFFSCVGLLSIAYLFSTPLVISPNRTHLEEKKEHLTKKAIGALKIEALIYIILLIVYLPTAFEAFSLGLFLSAVSRFAGQKVKHKKAD